jgi:ParB/RepB/Spo0J family partition protein
MTKASVVAAHVAGALGVPVETLAPEVAPSAELRYLALAALIESPLNPRRHFDATKLRELTDSIAKVGVLTPLVVRPSPGNRFEIGAGHRRFRAAKEAGLATVPCRVLSLDDTAFLELLVTENGQRADVHPLEEADGYRSLMERAGYDVARIAERVGRSIPYVYDRLKLLQLTPAAKKLFLAGAFTAGHAVVLARLSPADQGRAIGSDRSGNGRIGGLFVQDFGENDLALGNGDRAQKPVSVREFAKWIDDQVRFDRQAPDPMLFPETAQAVQAATEQKAKIIAITHDHMVPPEAKDEKDRTYSAVSWKRADGKETREQFSGRKMKSKTCDRSVIGVVVVGHGRGEAFAVCVDKKCAVHWPVAKKTPHPGGLAGPEDRDSGDGRADRDRWQAEEAKREAGRQRWEKAIPAVVEALIEKLPGVSAAPGGPLADILIEEALNEAKPPKNAPPIGTTAEDLVRHLAFLAIEDNIGWMGAERATKLLKPLGVGVKNIMDAAAPIKPEPAKPAPKPAAKAKGKKR